MGLISELETDKARKLTRGRQVLEVMRVVGTGVSVADAVGMLTAAYQEAECDFESFEWQGALVALLKVSMGSRTICFHMCCQEFVIRMLFG